MLYFFLSYAHGGRDDQARVQRFFADLSTEIAMLTGEDVGTQVGFHDGGALRLGDHWPRQLFEALCRAQTMIALFSPRYFRSDFCGREWAVFSARIRRWEQPAGPRQARLIPIFWVPTPVPDFLDHIQHHDPRLGAAYEREGLRELLREDGRDYDRFVLALARLVCEAVQQDRRLPEVDPRSGAEADLRAVSSAFHPPAEPVRPDAVAQPEPAPRSMPWDRSGRDADASGIPRDADERDADQPDIPQPRPILSLEAAEDLERPDSEEPVGDAGAAPHTGWGDGHDRP
ncbi:TIR-like protein FxsC [Plantactinospora sp. WMMB334]|uniref:TIR-like protein FxsC n=1 Tax=Plantactinospora sp. WMMB334 TaxID=3404119 RepID=UPI003B95F0E6